MEKALFDILARESRLIAEINTLSRSSKIYQGQLDKEWEDEDDRLYWFGKLSELSIELNERKLELVDVRMELKDYLVDILK